VHEDGVKFRVVVVDARPHFNGTSLSLSLSLLAREVVLM
jgi:hypothetical protein